MSGRDYALIAQITNDTRQSIKTSVPGYKTVSLNSDATINNATVFIDSGSEYLKITSGNYANLIKQLSSINLDSLIRTPQFDRTGIRARVDVCGEVSPISVPTLVSISTLGIAISSGDYGSNSKDLAYDNNTTTYWRSAQTSDIIGVAYIGRDFGTPKKVSHVKVTPYFSSDFNINSIKAETSQDGIVWTTVATVYTYEFDLPDYTPARYFRLLANSNSAAGNNSWVVPEILLQELVGIVPTAVGSNYIDFPVTASSVDDYYNDDIIVINQGTGAGQTRQVLNYNGTTKRAIVDVWTTQPSITSDIRLYDGIALDVQSGFSFKTINPYDHPTLNIITSLEKGTGATDDPVIGVPLINTYGLPIFAQRNEGTVNLVGAQATVSITLPYPVNVNSASIDAWAISTSASGYTVDVKPKLVSSTILELKFSGSNATAPIAYGWEVID